MRRREFIARAAGASAASPLAARAQSAGPMRRVGLFMNIEAPGHEPAARMAAFQRQLKELGWVEGRNLQIDVRWGAGNEEDARKYAAELMALVPDVIVASGTLSVAALQKIARGKPIVFVLVSDPVGAGLVESLARPGANVTGFMNFEYSLSGKWVELLKEIVPGVTRAAIIRDIANPAGSAQFGVIQGAASSLRLEVTPVSVRDGQEIDRAVAAFARQPNSGLIVTPSAAATVHRNLIIKLAALHKLPAVYTNRFDIVAGGLISYGPNRVNEYRGAAGYVDRILKGEQPASLPVQAPTNYELVINVQTAKALGLIVPPSILARADEVIE